MEVVSTENAAHYLWGDACDGWHLAKSQGLSVIQERVPVGCSEARHLHQRAEQFFFVLAGTETLEIDGRRYELVARQGFHVPATVPHLLSNNGDCDVEFLVISTPPSHGDRIAVPE